MNFEKDTMLKKLFFIGLGLLIPMLAAKFSRRVAGKGYEMMTSKEVPRNPAKASVAWKDAMIWALLSGALGGVSRMSARRFLSDTDIPSEGDDLARKADSV